jgi:hypothetical protein
LGLEIDLDLVPNGAALAATLLSRDSHARSVLRVTIQGRTPA